MSDATHTAPRSGLIRNLPLIGILAVAAIGAFTLRDYLSFEALADNRDVLIAFRDANYAATVLAFMALYVVIVAFSLPGATVARVAWVALASPRKECMIPQTVPNRPI